MLRHRIYYRLKPFVPRSIRLGIRRWFATRKRKEVRDVWPIVPASERRPADWLGWPAAGFRSGFMLHKLDWLHELNIQYDASTFDTDPFEPQPEGRHTIFPFWVTAPGARKSGASPPKASQRPVPTSATLRAGYVELPYTLPQDFTLFLLLREQTANIWLQKLDWIARHGGMALVNVHPDYLIFDGGTPK